jgi:glycosyltransferase involved in cell wall biosynthesis
MNHKGLKKRCAWWLYQRRDLKRANCHHATAEAEARNLQRLGLGVPVRVIPNGMDLPEPRSCLQSEDVGQCGGKTALFLGRIYPVKGLPMLVEAWGRVRPDGWALQIAGPDEAGHRAEVENTIAAAGLSDVVSFSGPIDGPAKERAFFNADLFLLPSYSENFGMAIAEALAHGLPVLTTKGTPWSRLSERGCGWWVDATVEGIAHGLRQATSCDRGTLQAMGARGHAWVKAEFGWGRVAKEFVETYHDLLKGSRCKQANRWLKPAILSSAHTIR